MRSFRAAAERWNADSGCSSSLILPPCLPHAAAYTRHLPAHLYTCYGGVPAVKVGTRMLPVLSLARRASPLDWASRTEATASGYGGPDVLIDVEQVGRVVHVLDRHQAVVIVPIRRSDALLALIHHHVHVGAAHRVG